MSLSKPSREAGDLIRQLGLRTTNDIFEDMNREFEEARAEKRERRLESDRQRKATAKAARTAEGMRNMQQGIQEQAGPSTAPSVSCVPAEEPETSK